MENRKQETENKWRGWKKVLWCPSTDAMMLKEKKTGGEVEKLQHIFVVLLSSATLANVWHGIKHTDVGGM